MLNEADTCREFVVPKLRAVGWDAEPHRISEQVTFTNGRIVVPTTSGAASSKEQGCQARPTTVS